MLHHDHEARRQLALEHAQLLADEMRRANPLTPAEEGRLGWARLAARLHDRRGRMYPGRSRHAPA